MKTVKNILAIASFALKTAWKLKIAQVLFGVCAGFVILLYINIDAGTSKLNFVRIFLAYANYVLLFISGIGTVGVCTYLFRSNMEQKYYHFLFTKPIRKLELYAGYVLGTAVLNSLVIICASALVFGLTCLTYGKAAPDEQQQIKNRIFAANRMITPIAPEQKEEKSITSLVADKKDRQDGIVLEQDKPLTWVFKNLDIPEKLTNVRINFYFFSSSTRKYEAFPISWTLKNTQSGQSLTGTLEAFPQKTSFIEFSPAITRNGTLEITLTNHNQHTSAFIPSPYGLNLSYPVAGFASNYTRMVLFQVLKCLYLTFATIFLCTFLTFPVALVSALMYFALTQLSSSLLFFTQQKNLLAVASASGNEPDPGAVDGIFKACIKVLYYISARFNDIDTIGMLSSGRAIEPTPEMFSIFGLWAFYAVLLFAAGTYILEKTEASKLER